MARIFGKIESLKSLKSELENNGIFRFNSVKGINDFLSNYNLEKLVILKNATNKLEEEYFGKCTNLNQKIQNRSERINLETEKIDNRVAILQKKIDFFNAKDAPLLKKLISNVKLYFLRNKSNYFLKNKSKLISSAVKDITRNIESDKLFIKKYETEKQNLIEKRTKSEIEKLEYTRKVLENSKNLISGAIGESLVVKEIEKLSDDYILINDFNLNFSPPIFYKKQNHRIYSIQIDHLLISKAGIFIIETKNWSKFSVNSPSLRSPIEQIKRSNFALYRYLSENIILNGHHWGEQQIPIRNVIVMMNNKPNADFKYVKIKLLREMNNYIKYFEPTLTENQLNEIVNNLNLQPPKN
jgi:hypothetical protein